MIEPDRINDNLMSINDNGAWCWYQGERAVIDPITDTLLVGSVAAPDGVDGAKRSGNVELSVVDLVTRKVDVVVLHEHLEADDHDVPGLYLRPDGRYLAMYAKHKSDNYSRWRISEKPHDPSSWGPEHVFDWTDLVEGRGATYSNLHYLAAEDRLYNFVRAINDDPSIMVSDDHGVSWRYAGKLFTLPKVGYVNAYTRYVDNGVDRIDFIATEHHPRDFNNNVYHGYLFQGGLYRGDGSVVEPRVIDGAGVPQTLLTKIFSADEVSESLPGQQILTHGWTTDLRRSATGELAAIMTCRASDVPENTNFDDHRFLYARYDGQSWQTHQLAKAGPALWADEQDYTGLGVVDPADLDTVYISTPIDPASGKDLPHHEIFAGHTQDGGRSWTWQAITANSAVDNFRPIAVPGSISRRVLLWFRGEMTRSQHYRTEVVGLTL